MSSRLKKCCQRSHQGNPDSTGSTYRADVSDELVKPPVAGHLPHDGDRQHQTRDTQRDQPQTAEPAPADAYRRQLCAGLRDAAGPVADDDRTVTVALVVERLQRLPQWIGLPRLHVAPSHAVGHARPAGLDRGRNVPTRQAAPIRSESKISSPSSFGTTDSQRSSVSTTPRWSSRVS